MSLHNFNSSNKSWKMYTNTLSSINGDPLTIKPYAGKNLELHDNIIIRKGYASYDLSNLITGTTSFVPTISDASFTNIDVSGNLNPLTDASGSLGTSIKRWGNAYIRDISSSNISIDGNISISGDISNIRQIIPQLTNAISTSLGTTSNIWQRAYISDLSNIVTINGTSWPPVGATGSTGLTGATGPNGPAGLFGLVVPPLKSMDISSIAVGGTLISNNTYMIHSFTTVGTTTFTVNSSLAIEYLVIAGGGGGGVGRGGGGGAGGVKRGTTILLPGIYNITVGAGGASVINDQQGGDGGTSSIGTLIVTTGGGGGGGWTIQSGRVGGSGGGMSAGSGIIGNGSGISGEGFAGSVRLDTSTGGGGGGAGAAASGKNGAIGITSEITGTAVNYAGGGGAGANTANVGVANGGTYAVANGTYGGGNGMYTSGSKPLYTDALPNTGGGGGGGEGYSGPSGAGGSGIVIIRYGKTVINSRITTTSRIYQNICGDISWNAVNGYYGLMKDAYPALNPLSSGVKAVQTWTNYSNSFIDPTSVCWCPKHQIFVCVSRHATSRGAISRNGRDWTTTLPYTGSGTKIDAWDICWSQELELFVVVASGGSTHPVVTSNDGVTWNTLTTGAPLANWYGVCWSAELGLFVSVEFNSNNVMVSNNGINWTMKTGHVAPWRDICWSPELKIFVAVGGDKVMTSQNGTNWTLITTLLTDTRTVCWSKELGIFVAVSMSGTYRVITSSNGLNWTVRTEGVTDVTWSTVTWCPQIGLFIVIAFWGNGMISSDGIKWTFVNTGNFPAWTYSGCWSPELGIFIAVGEGRHINSSLKGRPPTSYNMFDSSFNSIDETGKWTFENVFIRQELIVNTTTYSSDDRIKHNEVVINNGLDVIDQLSPKFYQKTQVLLDASYNGNLSNYAWIHEAGLIAQELLQISDLSFTVGGGDYYEQTYKYITQTNDLSNANYDISNVNYDISAINYEISNNLIAQPYNVNYNSIFIYGLAAIKELHAKFKSQQATLLNQKNIINSLLTKIEILENNRTN